MLFKKWENRFILILIINMYCSIVSANDYLVPCKEIFLEFSLLTKFKKELTHKIYNSVPCKSCEISYLSLIFGSLNHYRGALIYLTQNNSFELLIIKSDENPWNNFMANNYSINDTHFEVKAIKLSTKLGRLIIEKLRSTTLDLDKFSTDKTTQFLDGSFYSFELPSNGKCGVLAGMANSFNDYSSLADITDLLYLYSQAEDSYRLEIEKELMLLAK